MTCADTDTPGMPGNPRKKVSQTTRRKLTTRADTDTPGMPTNARKKVKQKNGN